jgi:hypothetical protein
VAGPAVFSPSIDASVYCAGAQLQVSLKISCSELSNKTKAVKYDISATVESLLKKKPLANWLKKLQMKKAKESKEQLYYGLYAPVNSGPGDLSPKGTAFPPLHVCRVSRAVVRALIY